MNYFDVILSLEDDEKVLFGRTFYPEGHALTVSVRKCDRSSGFEILEKKLDTNRNEYLAEQIYGMLCHLRSG